MVNNPRRRSQGGDVEGFRPIDTQWSCCDEGRPAVSNASFDPGYSLETTLNDAGTKINKADLLQGYCTYGKSIGEGAEEYED